VSGVRGGGGLRLVRGWRPVPILARVVAAREVWLGLLRRLTPVWAALCVPGDGKSARQIFPCGGASVSRTYLVMVGAASGGLSLLELARAVVGAVGDLARERERGGLTAAASLGLFVEGAVGALQPRRGLVSRLDERPRQLGRGAPCLASLPRRLLSPERRPCSVGGARADRPSARG
jgi:hypothetical protein